MPWKRYAYTHGTTASRLRAVVAVCMRAVKEGMVAVSQAVDIGRHISVGKANGERRGSQSFRGRCPRRRRRSCVCLRKARTPLAGVPE